MNFFEEVTLRLKQQLKVNEDKQVAEYLGMTGKAWTARKRRNSFPEKELWALVAQRPDLKLDVGYVLNGIKGSDAEPIKSLIGIINRYLHVYNLSSAQADEALSFPPGTISDALSFKLDAEPKGRK